MKKKNYAIVVLVVILISLAVGYATFSTNLNITGTAVGTGTWDVKFINPTISNSKGTAVADADGKAITVNAKLAFPGDACTVTANIKNSGNMPAKLTSFNLTGSDGKTAYSDENITVTVPEIAQDGSEVIQAGETCPVTFVVKWNDDSKVQNVSSEFKINFTYEQSQTSVNATPSHGTHTSN